MSGNLGTVFDQFVADLLKEGLRLLKEKEELKQLRLAEMRQVIAIGTAETERGGFVDGEEVFAEIRKRSAA